MNNIITDGACTGCGVCYLSCNQNAITFKEDELGFFMPVIETEKCVSCGKCRKACPQNNPVSFHYPQRCFAAWSKNKENWIFSASGGIGAEIAEYAFLNDFCVYGCDYDSNGELKHFCAESIDDIKKIRSSKYSRSLNIEAFKEIKQHLKNNKKVLYIGTPCQTSALIRYTNNNENLLTVDLVCHGTPPGKYIKEHISHICGLPIDKLRFRGEFDQKLTIWQDNNIVYQKDKTEDLYFRAFYDNMISYDSCYTCNYAKPERCSDITIADFWGLGQLNSIKRCTNRPSLVLINTEKGNCFFDLLKSRLYFEEREVCEGINGNGRLNKAPSKNDKAIRFQKYYPKYGLDKSIKKIYFQDNLHNKIEKQKLTINNLQLFCFLHKVIRKLKRLKRGLGL